MDLGSGISQHVARIENIARQLSDVGENISNVAIMTKILGSLPPKYHSFVTAWKSVNPERQTLNHLRERLLTEESRITPNVTLNDNAVNALASVNVKGKSAKVTQGNQKSSEYKKSELSKTNVECFYCHKKGHLIRDCRKRKANDKHQKEKDNKSDVAALIASNTDSSARNNCTNKDINSILQEDTRNVWFLDSGASKHISFRREWFNKFCPSQDKLISMGDNTTCEIKGSGTISVKRLKNGVWLDINLENIQYVPDFKKNLISVGACSNKGLDISFSNETVKIRNEKDVIVQSVK